MKFTVLDWIIVLVYLGASITAGLIGRKWVAGVADFLVAGRSLGLHIGIATLAATEIGTVTFMYYAQLRYTAGYAALVNGLISGGVMIGIGITGFVVKRLRDLQLMTIPEFFEIRYSRTMRIVTGFLVAAGGILNMGVFLRIEGTFLALISGIPLQYLKVVMTAILLLELAYTVVGGMISIVLTDFIQFVMMSLAILLVTIYSVHAAGWNHMGDAVSNSIGNAGFNPLTNPDFGWTFIIFQILFWTAIDTCWQTTAMRTFSASTSEIGRRVFTWTGLIFLGRGMMPMVWGIAALVVVGPGHDSLEAMPMMLGRILPVGIRGLVAAGMLAATMSTNSSYLLGWSSVLAQDLIGPMRRTPFSSRGQLLLNRLCNAFVSVFILFWGLWYTLPGPAYFYFNMTSTIALAGTFAAIVAGLYWKRANTFGGFCALSGGVLGAIAFFLLRWPAKYAGFAAFTLAGLGMAIGSLLSKRQAVPAPI